MPPSSGPSGSTAKTDGSTTGAPSRTIPTWQTSASSSTAKRSARSALPRSRWRVIVVRSVGDRTAVMALVCRRSGLLSRATSAALRQDTSHGPTAGAPARARPRRRPAAEQPGRRPDPRRDPRRHPPDRRPPAQHPLARGRPGRLPRGHRAGLRPADRRGLDRGTARLRHVRGRRRTRPALATGRSVLRSPSRPCSDSTPGPRGSTPGTVPPGAAPGATCPRPRLRRRTTIPRGCATCASSSPPTWRAPAACSVTPTRSW